MAYIDKVKITDTAGGDINSDGLGHLDTVGHAHEEGGHALFNKNFSGVSNQDFILIDVSDTTNYPHDNTNWIHFGNIIIDVDANTNAQYTLEMGFLENVDATDGDFHSIYKWEGSKSTGNTFREVIATNPENVKAKASSNIGPISLNDLAFQTDVNLASTKNPLTADTPSGNGDIVLRVTNTTGTGDFNVSIGIVYHSH